MQRGWGVALLALSVGLNLGLAVAVLQRRMQAPPPPAAVAAPAPRVAVASPPVSAPPAAAPAPPPQPAPTAASPPVAAPTVVARRPAASEPRGETAAPPPPPPGRWVDHGDEPPPPPEEQHGAAGARDVLGPAYPGPGAGGRGGPGPGGPTPARLEEVAARLGVPPEDRPRFIALQRRFIAETRERRQQLEAVRREMKQELVAPTPQPERLRALANLSAQLQASLERALVEHVLQARQILHGEAERRYLELLAELGPRLAGPPRQGPPGGQAFGPEPLGRRGGQNGWQQRPGWQGQRPAPWRGRGGAYGPPPGEPQEPPEPQGTPPGEPRRGPRPDGLLEASVAPDAPPQR